MSVRLPIALTIAGSDSGAGAGIQADIRTFAALGVYCASAITAVTAQNTLGVEALHEIPPANVAAQIVAVVRDFDVAAFKIGMLLSEGAVDVVAAALLHAKRRFSVLDPVMVASSGDALISRAAIAALKKQLLPLVDCLTPNLAEAAALLDQPVAGDEAAMARQGAALLKLGPRAVLMKGGHLPGDAVDILVSRNGERRYAAPRLASRNLHGTGCTLSSAIAAQTILGLALGEAIAAAKAFVRQAIVAGEGITLGAGPGPLAQTPLKRVAQPAGAW